MRKYCILIVVLLLFLTGCSDHIADVDSEKVKKPVAIMEVKEETYPVMLHYTGVIKSEEVKKYSFKIPGKIDAIFVEEGQLVTKGEKLASLNQDEINNSTYELEKVKSNYNFIKDYYEKSKRLYEEGAISRQDFQNITLEMDQAQYTLEQTQRALELREEDTLITADSDGYVLSIESRSNEVTGAGIPVVVVGSKGLIAQIGLNQEDISKIEEGDEAEILIDDTIAKGTVETINKFPDEESRTYTVDIAIEDNIEVNMGTVIQVSVKAGTQKGIWVPIQYLLNDGEDYVFVVENGMAKRINVTLGDLLEEKVCVEGLEKGEQLITEGVKSVKDGTEVTVKKSEEDTMDQLEAEE